MMAMYTRVLTPPKSTFFLLGPRGTGKTFWLQENFPDVKRYDLLRTSEFLRLLKSPDLLRQDIETLPSGSWIIIDEIQKLPQLLDEVHSLITDSRGKYKFALTGSSARKLKRSGANLLPGRSINRIFFPLTLRELNQTPTPESLMRWGGLPAVRSAIEDKDEMLGIDLLETYVQNYLRQEIQEEAAVKRLEPFVRFFEVTSIMNGQLMNQANISREAGIARPTVQGYFDVLVETLIGTYLPSWRRRVKIKEVGHPKFYFFDPGLVRALAGRLREPLDSIEAGYLLETWVFHELRAWISYSGCGGELSYWRTTSGTEVDFIWTRGKKAIGIEVKLSNSWKSEWSRPLLELAGDGYIQKGFGIYLGKQKLKIGKLSVFPFAEFFDALYKGEVIES